MTNQQTFLSTARDVINKEADALKVLSAELDEEFSKAIDLLLSAEGRVIVTGIGKSGHIAHKIAATLASTGTPAQFVHPAEASHGDLGMIAANDVVLAISNSGEAPELADLISYSRRYKIPLIGITKMPQSSLGQQADIILRLPDQGEACGTGVVPTISTTMTLAFGDALAVTLMRSRAFTAENFKRFHPGGKLGAQLAHVSDLMHPGDAMPLVTRDTLMSDALIEMTRKSLGVVGVLDDDGELVGIITDGDLRRHMDGLLSLRASDVMTADPMTIFQTALAQKAVLQMTERKITSVFAVDEAAPKRPLGILHIHDCLRAGLG